MRRTGAVEAGSGQSTDGQTSEPEHTAPAYRLRRRILWRLRNDSQRIRALTHTVRSPFFTGPLRSPLRIQNTFANECFIDELCVHAKADPVTFRLQHLRDPRVIGVIQAAAKAAKWEARTPPAAIAGKTGIVRGRGIACVDYEGGNGYAALIAEIVVNLETGLVRPTRFVVAQDCGPISNPDGLRNQIEGGILQGMSRALVEEVTWDNRRITSIDWETYNSLHRAHADLHRMLMAIVSWRESPQWSGTTARVPQYGNDVLKSCGRIMALSGRTRLRNSGRSQQKSE